MGSEVVDLPEFEEMQDWLSADADSVRSGFRAWLMLHSIPVGVLPCLAIYGILTGEPLREVLFLVVMAVIYPLLILTTYRIRRDMARDPNCANMHWVGVDSNGQRIEFCSFGNRTSIEIDQIRGWSVSITRMCKINVKAPGAILAKARYIPAWGLRRSDLKRFLKKWCS